MSLRDDEAARIVRNIFTYGLGEFESAAETAPPEMRPVTMTKIEESPVADASSEPTEEVKQGGGEEP
ncbi:hypothetical protein FRB90_006007, partial [Tulasnella sp. 427]